MNSMDTAPKDREILVFARWDWDNMGDCAGNKFAWRVARWEADETCSQECFWSVSDNPYTDLAVDPKGWADLPSDDQ